jgi:hypothetical protein
MNFDQLTIATTVRIVCNAYLYSCLFMMGFSYLGYWVISHLENPNRKEHFHWFG